MAGSAAQHYTLWGTSHSLYTPKIRSCLIKRSVPFREFCPPHPRFRAEVKPAIRRASSPHTLWHFDPAASHAVGLVGKSADALTVLLERTGGEWLKTVTLARPLRRRDYVLVVA